MKVLILGAGASALSALKQLAGHDCLVVVEAAEKAAVAPLVAALGGAVIVKAQLDLTINFDLVIRSPGLPRTDPLLMALRQQGRTIISEIELAYLLAPYANYLAITGSNGKTTCCQLLYELLKQRYDEVYLGGNIGQPLSALVDYLTSDSLVVVEVSSFQLEDTHLFRPLIGGILNLSPNHLDSTGDLDYYYRSKMKLASLSKLATFYNEADAVIKHYWPAVIMPVLPFNGPHSKFHFVDGKLYFEKKRVFDLKDGHLIGEHNQENILLACSIAQVLGVSLRQIAKGLKQFQAPPFRLQLVKSINGVSYYNDAKSTTPEATIKALAALKDYPKIHLLMGGKDKGLSYLGVGGEKVVIYPFGQAAEQIKEELNLTNTYPNLGSALQAVQQVVKPGEVVLLSPSCASYDQYRSYKERGRHFNRLLGVTDETL